MDNLMFTVMLLLCKVFFKLTGQYPDLLQIYHEFPMALALAESEGYDLSIITDDNLAECEADFLAVMSR